MFTLYYYHAASFFFFFTDIAMIIDYHMIHIVHRLHHARLFLPRHAESVEWRFHYCQLLMLFAMLKRDEYAYIVIVRLLHIPADTYARLLTDDKKTAFAVACLKIVFSFSFLLKRFRFNMSRRFRRVRYYTKALPCCYERVYKPTELHRWRYISG